MRFAKLLPARFPIAAFIEFLERDDKYGFTVERGPLRTQAEWWHHETLLMTHVTHWKTGKHISKLHAHHAALLGLSPSEAEIGMACHLRRPCLLFLLLIYQLLRQRENNATLFHRLLHEATGVLTQILEARGATWNDHEAAAIKKRSNDLETITSWPETAAIAQLVQQLAV